MESQETPIDYAMLHGLTPLPDWAQKLSPEEQTIIRRKLAVRNGYTGVARRNAGRLEIKLSLIIGALILYYFGTGYIINKLEEKQTQKTEQHAKATKLNGQAESIRLNFLNKTKESTR